MKKFSVHKKGKYYDVRYHGCHTMTGYLDIRYPNNMYQCSRKDVEKYITYLVEVEKAIVEYQAAFGFHFEAGFLVRRALKLIDSLASGLDIRSGWSYEKIAQVLVDSYHKQVQDAEARCSEIWQQGIPDGDYLVFSDRDYDEYERLRKEYDLDVEDILQHKTEIATSLEALHAGLKDMLETLKARLK
jgi:DNA repair ATPase RecN